MKKVFYWFFFLIMTVFLHAGAFSQITLTTSDLPNFFGVGKSWFTYGKPTSNGIVTMNVGMSSNSSSQSWTLPTVIFQDSSRWDNVFPSATSYAASFPGATYAQPASGIDAKSGLAIEIYQFSRLSNDSLYNMGSVEHAYGTLSGHAFDTMLINHTTRFDAIFPIQLGTSISSPADTTNLGSGLIQIVTSIETYDAFGTLILPIGSFSALRSKKVVTTNVYSRATLLNTSLSTSFTWITREGHQMGADADTGASSGNVTLTSGSLTYVLATPATLVKTRADIPAQFVLNQNYPNPFNPSTAIEFQITNREAVHLTIFNVLGQVVATLVNQTLEAGTYTAKWNAASMPSGMYVYRLQAGQAVEIKKMVLLK